MPAKDKLSSINLVPKDEFEKSIFGQALKWALTAGRSIVVLTEFVVILAFLSRFYLDRRLNDLNEIIIQKAAVVDSFKEVEDQMRLLQDQLSILTQANSNNINAASSLSQISSFTPFDTIYSSIELKQDNIKLVGLSGSESGLASLIAALKNSPDFTDISLGDIEFSQRKGGTLFTISAQRATTTSKPSPTPIP